jgi:DNA primase small subunit
MIGFAKATQVVRGAFREYYFKWTKAIEEPDKIEQREFGYAQFDHPGMTRHLSFSSIKELHAMLVKEVPSDVYCSNAYYKFPTQSMQEKQWLGADLIFDIDGKDLDLPCIPSHTYPLCTSCGHVSPLHGKKEYSCQSCSGKKAEYISIPCNKCIEGSKNEVRRLIEFLTGDLGMQRNNIRIYFSGNNGFHIYIGDGEYMPLDSQARSDIVGYLSGAGLLAESVGVRKGRQENMSFIKFPRGGVEYGWRGRIADELKIDGSSIIKLKHIVDQKGGYSGFKTELDKMAREMGVRIDPQVTTDVHRIFRMPGTLNSKSGLAKIKCADLESFDPFNDACLLGSTKVSVRVKTHIKLKLKSESFNISKESAELPAFAAIYLICKGLAEAI